MAGAGARDGGAGALRRGVTSARASHAPPSTLSSPREQAHRPGRRAGPRQVRVRACGNEVGERGVAEHASLLCVAEHLILSVRARGLAGDHVHHRADQDDRCTSRANLVALSLACYTGLSLSRYTAGRNATAPGISRLTPLRGGRYAAGNSQENGATRNC
jgi:hypothetical protein